MVARDDLLVSFQGESISLATPDALRSTLEARLIPGITRWNRLEGRPRSVDFDQAMRAEIRDPLWNLSKQWQVGEFAGEDAGSPAGASILIEQAKFAQFAAADHPLEPLDDTEPLEMRIERQPLAWSFGDRLLALDLRLALGRRWRKMLGGGLEVHFPAFLSAYSVAAPDPANAEQADIVAHARIWQRFEAVAGEMMDGGALFLFLDSNPAHLASAGIAGPTPSEATAIDALGADFVKWVRGLLAVPDAGQDGWRPERLEYAASVTTEAVGGPSRRDDETLVAGEISDGRVDWYHFDRRAREGRPAATAPADPPVAFLPTPLDYGGMPNPRWWQFEEGATNFGTIDPGSSDIGKLLFLDHVLLYANDWYIFPHRVAAGSNSLVRGLAIRNVFGERFWVTAAGARDSESWQGWGMFANNALSDPTDLSDRHITVLPVAAKIQDAEAAEIQMLIRDEMANQVWGIEKKVRAPSGQVLAGAHLAGETRRWYQSRVVAVPAPAQPTEAALRYQLMTRVPENWIPLVPVHKAGDNRQTKLQRAAMPRLLDGDHSTPARIRPRTTLLREGLAGEPRLPMFVENEEVPRAGVQVIDGFRRTRWYGGATFVWRGIRKHSGRGEGSSGLAFDQLFPKPVEEPAASVAAVASATGPIEVSADPPPSLALTAHAEADGGWRLEIVAGNFAFAPEHAGQTHVEGEGQVQLLVNGIAVATLHGGWHHLPPLLEGDYQLAVAALANDGRPLAKDGIPISATVAIAQGPVPADEDHGAAEIVAGPDVPALTLDVLPLEDGGSMLHVGFSDFALAPAAAGDAHVPGEGHFHLLVDGLEIARLYAEWYRLPALAAGVHSIVVTAYTNDHRPYETSEGPVTATAEIEATEGRPLTLPEPEEDHDEHDEHDEHGEEDEHDHG